MNLEMFEERARELWSEIPTTSRQGVERLSIQSEARGHPDFDWVYTMGECLTENWPSGFGGEGDTRSELILYHGSFEALSKDETAFDWEGELWETILHELLHHREAAAGEVGLDLYDWAEEQNFRRLAGEVFDPDFHKAVPADADGVVRLESQLFVEASVEEGASEAVFEWRGRTYSVHLPEGAHRAFIEVRNLAGGRLCVVCLRRRPWWKFGRSADRELIELERSALPMPAARM